MSVDWNNELMSAIGNYNLKSVDKALKNGADVNTEDQNQWTPLLKTILYRHSHLSFDMFKMLVSRGANINRLLKPDWGKGNTVLAICVKDNLDEYAKYLINVGANVCKVGKGGKTPLSWAVSNKNIEMIELLLEHGAHFTTPGALLEAIELNNLEIVKILISRGANVNLLYRNEYTPLTRALEIVDCTEIVKELVDNGADVNIPDCNGNHPLIKSIRSGCSDIARLFLEKGANTDKPDTDQNYPLTKSTELGNLELVKTLIEKGANLKVTDKLGRSPFIIALQEDHFELVKYFVQQGEDVNQIVDNEETPLSIAAANLNYQMFQFLVDSGAHINLAEEKIQEIATENEHFDLFLKNKLSIGKNKDTSKSLGSNGQENAV